ncbi:MAG: response regulator transcription factor [Anaerolineae bacterium]|jgi:DNA-binding response OmpR family regulator|nr:response regulator transcription factor [Anaerolineae bacterium]
MNNATLLLIGRSGTKDDSTYIDALQKRYTLKNAPSGKQALECVRMYSPRLAVLDAVSMRTPGDRISRMLRDSFGQLPIVHIHPGRSDGIESAADVLFTPPLNTRRLLNSIERLLKAYDGDDEILQCGNFQMNVPRRLLIYNGLERPLNPKQASLLELFFRHPNEVIERKRLMETVWQTEYLGDTRTLDVHIRWVRQALEESGKNLKTIRGIGYCLEVAPITE